MRLARNIFKHRFSMFDAVGIIVATATADAKHHWLALGVITAWIAVSCLCEAIIETNWGRN